MNQFKTYISLIYKLVPQLGINSFCYKQIHLNLFYFINIKF